MVAIITPPMGGSLEGCAFPASPFTEPSAFLGYAKGTGERKSFPNQVASSLGGSLHSSPMAKTGKLGVAASPQSREWIATRFAEMRQVEVDGDAIRWEGDGKSPGGALHADDIASVRVRGASVVVGLTGEAEQAQCVTLVGSSGEEARAWCEAIRPLAARPPQQKKLPAAGGDPVTLRWEEDGATRSGAFELLVIACDPRSLVDVCDFDDDERELWSELEDFTFHTTLLEVRTPPGGLEHGVIFAPKPLSEVDGDVYAFRNETAKQFGVAAASRLEKNLVTVYQLRGHGLEEWSSERFQEVLRAQLPRLDWWPYGQPLRTLSQYTTPYFNHFHNEALRAGRPWELLERQGRRRTLLVHATACFESILHCWQYIQMLLNKDSGVARDALPAETSAAIAVIGAGPSGLLVASLLKGQEYHNVVILERLGDYGGKTQTRVVADAPRPRWRPRSSTVCELGACYMSPAYDQLVKALAPYLSNNPRIDFAKGQKSFRGIAPRGQLPESYPGASVMSYTEYVFYKAAKENGFEFGLWSLLRAGVDIVRDFFEYNRLHTEYVQGQTPMPRRRPDALDGAFGEQSFRCFLEHHELHALIGVMQYAYEVQGYGPLEDIPAYYGLLWMTPAVTQRILLSVVPGSSAPVVTAWAKGWRDVWDQLVAKQQLDVRLSVTVQQIRRPTG